MPGQLRGRWAASTRCASAHKAQIRQSRPHFGLDFQTKSLWSCCFFARKRTWTMARALGGFCEMRIGARVTLRNKRATLGNKRVTLGYKSHKQESHVRERTWTIARALGGFCEMRIGAAMPSSQFSIAVPLPAEPDISHRPFACSVFSTVT